MEAVIRPRRIVRSSVTRSSDKPMAVKDQWKLKISQLEDDLGCELNERGQVTRASPSAPRTFMLAWQLKGPDLGSE